MKADFPALWAESPVTLRREPTNSEMAGGFPCGDLDLQLFNELTYRLAQNYREAITVIQKMGIVPNANSTDQLYQAILALVKSLSPAGAQFASAFTAGAALTNFPGGANSTSGPFTVAQTKTIVGASYAVIDAVCAFRGGTSEGTDCRARVRTTVQGGSPVISQKYQGVRVVSGVQTPAPVNITLQNLDPTKSLFVELLVDRTETAGSIPVYDPRIDIQHNGNP